jgi:hypothetical protein
MADGCVDIVLSLGMRKGEYFFGMQALPKK